MQDHLKAVKDPNTTQRIRVASARDVPDVLAVWTAAEAHTTVSDTIEAVAHLVAQLPKALMVAEVDDQIVGTLIAAWDGWRGNLYRLAVLPGYRRRGIGTALVTYAAQRMRERGVQRLSAFVVAEDAHALAFWDSLVDIGLQRDPLPKERYVCNL